MDKVSKDIKLNVAKDITNAYVSSFNKENDNKLAEVEQEVARAKQTLRTQVASIAIAGAEKILRASIDEAANSEIVEQLAAEL